MIVPADARRRDRSGSPGRGAVRPTARRSGGDLVRAEGLEPSRGYPQRILSAAPVSKHIDLIDKFRFGK
jgi:hypothetical protein